MTFECFTSKQQQALLVIMFFTLSFAGVEPHRGDYAQVFAFIAKSFIVLTGECADGGGKHQHQRTLNSFYTFNSFETINNTKITAQIGGTAVLPCIVEASSPATVTWIRRSDYRLLTGKEPLKLFL